MKKKMTIVLLALSCAISPMTLAGENGKKCDTDEPQPSPNPIISIVSFPFKLVAVMTWGPRCALQNIPKNPPQE